MKGKKLEPSRVAGLVADILNYLENHTQADYDERIAALKSAASVLENVMVQAQVIALSAHNMEKFTR